MTSADNIVFFVTTPNVRPLSTSTATAPTLSALLSSDPTRHQLVPDAVCPSALPVRVRHVQQPVSVSAIDPDMLIGMPRPVDYARYFGHRLDTLNQVLRSYYNPSSTSSPVHWTRLFSPRSVTFQNLHLSDAQKSSLSLVTNYRGSYMRMADEIFSLGDNGATHVETRLLRLCPCVGFILQHVSYDVVKTLGLVSSSSSAMNHVSVFNVCVHSTKITECRFSDLLFPNQGDFVACTDHMVTPKTFVAAFVLRALCIADVSFHGVTSRIWEHDTMGKRHTVAHGDNCVSGPFTLAQLVAAGCNLKSNGTLEIWDGQSVGVHLSEQAQQRLRDVGIAAIESADNDMVCSISVPGAGRLLLG